MESKKWLYLQISFSFVKYFVRIHVLEAIKSGWARAYSPIFTIFIRTILKYEIVRNESVSWQRIALKMKMNINLSMPRNIDACNLFLFLVFSVPLFDYLYSCNDSSWGVYVCTFDYDELTFSLEQLNKL